MGEFSEAAAALESRWLDTDDRTHHLTSELEELRRRVELLEDMRNPPGGDPDPISGSSAEAGRHFPFFVALPKDPRIEYTNIRTAAGARVVPDIAGHWKLTGDVVEILIELDDISLNLNGYSADRIQVTGDRVRIINGRVNKLTTDWKRGVSDLTVRNISNGAGETFQLRGRRILVDECTLSAISSVIWSGDIADQRDMVLRDCVFTGGSEQAVVRVESMINAAVVGCNIRSTGKAGQKHALRFHNTMREPWVSTNLGVFNSRIEGDANGLMIGGTTGERGIGDVYVHGNTFKSTGPDKFNLQRDWIDKADVQNNTLWLPNDGNGRPAVWNPFQSYLGATPSGWVWKNNNTELFGGVDDG